MSIRDALGKELEVGTAVALVVGDELGLGTIKKIDSGLGITQTDKGVQGQQASIFIEIFVQKSVLPNGVAIGVLKIEPPEQPKTIAES